MKNVLPVNKTYRLSAAVLSMALLFSACSAPTAPETESPAQSNYVAEAHKKETTGILPEDAWEARGDQPEEIMPEEKLFDQGQQVENGNIRLTFQDMDYYDNIADSGIELEEDSMNYYIRYGVIDEASQCVGRARIAKVQVNIANLAEEPETINLKDFNIRFYETDTGKASVTREVEYMDPIQPNDNPKKRYEYTLGTGEDVDFTLGYVLLSDDVENMEKGKMIPTMEVNNLGYLPTDEIMKEHLDEMAYIQLPIPGEEP